MTGKDIQIESRDLNIWYGNARANKVTAVIGPSGRRKSTFLRCINRMNDLIKDCHIKLGKMKQIFENPEKKSTEDYITGRFG
ncbi:MAG: hypothetical protein ACT6FG_06255 [Methanosarcinaceae archaeon]